MIFGNLTSHFMQVTVQTISDARGHFTSYELGHPGTVTDNHYA